MVDGPAAPALPSPLALLKANSRLHRRGFLTPDDAQPQQHRTPSSKTVEQLIGRYLVPKYVTLFKNPPKLPRTRTTLKARVLEFEMYTGEYVGSTSDSGSSRGSSSSDSDGRDSPEEGPVVRRGSHSTESRLEYYETGVLRRMAIPENYTLAHLTALVCLVMGWPLTTAIAASVQPAFRSEPMAQRWGWWPDEKEIWMHLIQAEDDEVAPSMMPKRRAEERVRISDVWPQILPGHQGHKEMLNQRRDLHGLDTARIRPSSICIRIHCLSSGFYPLCLPTDEPHEIMGIGAPPASYLPRIRDVYQPLEERYGSKQFNSADFQPGTFWDFVDGSVVSEVDVQGVWLWRRYSPEFVKRLGILERRANGDWMTDLEEEVLVFS